MSRITIGNQKSIIFSAEYGQCFVNTTKQMSYCADDNIGNYSNVNLISGLIFQSVLSCTTHEINW